VINVENKTKGKRKIYKRVNNNDSNNIKRKSDFVSNIMSII
jgi:hypothetical protein